MMSKGPARPLETALVHRRKRASLGRAECGEGIEMAKFAREGHEVAWEFDSPAGGYAGRMLIDGEIYTPSEATKKFLQDGS